MAVTLMCPNLRCRKILVVPGSVRGNRVRCVYCGQVLLVPDGRSSQGKKTNPVTVPDEAKPETDV